MNNEVDPKHRPGWIYVNGGWVGGRLQNKITTKKNLTSNNTPPGPATPSPSPNISLKNTARTTGRGFYGKSGAQDETVSFYRLN